jgi:hypothetical protein
LCNKEFPLQKKKSKTQSESQRGKGTNYVPDHKPEANQQKKGMGNLKEQ